MKIQTLGLILMISTFALLIPLILLIELVPIYIVVFGVILLISCLAIGGTMSSIETVPIMHPDKFKVKIFEFQRNDNKLEYEIYIKTWFRLLYFVDTCNNYETALRMVERLKEDNFMSWNRKRKSFLAFRRKRC